MYKLEITLLNDNFYNNVVLTIKSYSLNRLLEDIKKLDFQFFQESDIGIKLLNKKTPLLCFVDDSAHDKKAYLIEEIEKTTQ